MNTEQKNLLKNINQQVAALGKLCNYITDLNDSISLNGFLLIDEKAYLENLKDVAIKKSNLIALFSENNNFSFWNNNTTLTNQNIICYLAYSKQLDITPKENEVLTNTTILHPEYNSEIAQKLLKKTQDTFHDLHLTQIQTKKEALKVILANEKYWESKQHLAKTLHKVVGEKYDEIWQQFKTAIKYNALTIDNECLTLETTYLGKPQLIQFHTNPSGVIFDITFKAAVSDIVKQIREGNSKPNSLTVSKPN
jgi:hypothetical protein